MRHSCINTCVVVGPIIMLTFFFECGMRLFTVEFFLFQAQEATQRILLFTFYPGVCRFNQRMKIQHEGTFRNNNNNNNIQTYKVGMCTYRSLCV